MDANLEHSKTPGENDSHLTESFFKDPPPKVATKSSVEKFAEELASFVEYNPGDDLEPIVKRLGGTIHSRWEKIEDISRGKALPKSLANNSAEYFDGVLIVHAPKDFDILLSPYTGLLRDRFTIAHEIGHYFLHSNQGQIPIIATRTTGDRSEWEANWFAAAFLMPASIVLETWEKKKGDVSSVASKFWVSEDAAKIRLKSLGLISE